MNFSIVLNKEEEKLFKKYVKEHHCSLEEALKNALLEKIENEYDAVLAEHGYKEYLKNPTTISHEELLKDLGMCEG